MELLTRGPRDAPERHRTLRATIEWSHALLEPREQQAFARLAVFAGGCTMETAGWVCDAAPETLESLVDKSLLQYDGERVSMLETIREYARERLDTSGDSDVVTRRLGERLAEAGEAFAAEYEQGRNPPVALLERELDNIRAVSAALHATEDAAALRLTIALGWFWTISGRYGEGLAGHSRAWSMRGGGRACCARIPSPRPLALRRSLRTHRDAPSARKPWPSAAQPVTTVAWERCCAGLANAYCQSGDAVRARSLYAENLALQERVGSPVHLARAYRMAGEIELELGDPVRARVLLSSGRSILLGASRRPATP